MEDSHRQTTGRSGLEGMSRASVLGWGGHRGGLLGGMPRLVLRTTGASRAEGERGSPPTGRPPQFKMILTVSSHSVTLLDSTVM